MNFTLYTEFEGDTMAKTNDYHILSNAQVLLLVTNKTKNVIAWCSMNATSRQLGLIALWSKNGRHLLYWVH
jgi:hypothetical protein